MGPIGPYGQISNVQFTANKAISSSATRCKVFFVFSTKNMAIFSGSTLSERCSYDPNRGHDRESSPFVKPLGPNKMSSRK